VNQIGKYALAEDLRAQAEKIAREMERHHVPVEYLANAGTGGCQMVCVGSSGPRLIGEHCDHD
jgi:hypothetical protein